ncbi:MAG TPA: DUF3883 domain-containing protein [Caulobacteraceae bacterium]
MADSEKAGTDWGDDELDLIVAEYFAMLALDQADERFVKRQRAKALMTRVDRSHASVEFKHGNISAVLEELGYPIVRGYKPRFNYQNAILDAIERHLSGHAPNWSPVEKHAVFESIVPFLEEAPSLQPPKERRPELERLVRKFDPGERDFRNRALGKAGEETVLHFERNRLQAEDRADLARKVRWVAQEDGDGAGYDIRSFDRQGRERLIEVKTTTGGRTTPFYLSRNEYDLSKERMDAFRLMRVHSFARDPRMFELKPPLTEAVLLSPSVYQAIFG